MLRRIDFGDYDLIITFFTLTRGKLSIIAKSAKKSAKRFSGILELFTVLDVVLSAGRRKGLFVLQEATLKQPFPGIRSSIIKTAYASYWAELIDQWMENGQKQIELYNLFYHVLEELDLDRTTEAALSILFQLRFLTIAGLGPNLSACNTCRIDLDHMKKPIVYPDLASGGLICDDCSSVALGGISLSKGTIKQLLWVERGDLRRAVRIRFTPTALKEGLKFLEAFVPYHLGKEPRSLKFLRQIRR